MHHRIWLASVIAVFLLAILALNSASQTQTTDDEKNGLAKILTAQGYQPIKLVRSARDRYFTKVTVNRKPVSALVDTGAVCNGLDPLFAEKQLSDLCKPFRINTTAKDVAYVFNENSVVCPDVAVGDLIAPRMRCCFHEMASKAQEEGRLDWGFILGANFLHYYSAVIDYNTDTLWLQDPVKLEPGVEGDWIESDLVSEGEQISGVEGRTAFATLSIHGFRGEFSCNGTTQKFDVALAPKFSPRRMDWHYPTSFVKPLIYKLDKDSDTLTVTGQLFATSEKRCVRPTEFVSRAGTPVSVLVLKRVKKS